MNKEFIRRLDDAFDHASMADVARRLQLPHATVRNYYQGRLPSAEVLIKIAEATGISLNWLLMGVGDMYAGERPPVGIGRFLEERITEMIEQKISGLAPVQVQQLGAVDGFDVESAVKRHTDAGSIMAEWFAYEGRELPDDYGVVFFKGWESFSLREKADALRDAKRILDRSLRAGSDR